MQTQIEIRDLRNGDWYWIHKTILEKYANKIGAYGIAVYNALCYFANQNTQKLFPSYKEIAQKAGCGWRTVQRIIPILEKYKIVKREKRTRYSYIYSLLKICQTDISQNKICQTDIKICPTGMSDMPVSRTNRCINKNYLTRIINKKDGLLKANTDISLKRKEIKYPKKDYDVVLEAYQKLRDITLQGKEFDPVMQNIKTMFMSNRSVDDIIGCMQWLTDGEEEWMENWTIRTARLKLPFYLKSKKQLTYKKY